MSGFWKSLFGGQPETRSEFLRTSGDILTDDTGSGWIYWMGLDSGGGAEPIGPHGPWPTGHPFQPVVTRATSLITGPLTAAPFTVTDGSVTPRWLSDPMLVRADYRVGIQAHPAAVRLPRSLFWAEWIRAAIWYGHGPLLFAEDGAGQPIPGTMRVLNPLLVTTKRADDASLRWAIEPTTPDGEQAVFDRDGRLNVGGVEYRLTVLRNPHSPVDGEARSRGVFEMHPDAFNLTRQIASYTSGTFRSGIPAGYLKVTDPKRELDQSQANELKRRWLENHGGDRRSIAVLNATTEFTPLNLSPVDAALADVKTLATGDVAFAFGLDPMTLGASLGDSMTYSNLRDAWSNHRDFGLAPWIAAVQDTLSALRPSGSEVRVDVDDFANPTLREQYEAGEIATRAGLLTINEWRASKNLPPIPGGDNAPNTTDSEDAAASGGEAGGLTVVRRAGPGA